MLTSFKDLSRFCFDKIFSSSSKKRSSFLNLIWSSMAVARLVCISISLFFSNNIGNELTAEVSFWKKKCGLHQIIYFRWLLHHESIKFCFLIHRCHFFDLHMKSKLEGRKKISTYFLLSYQWFHRKIKISARYCY